MKKLLKVLISSLCFCCFGFMIACSANSSVGEDSDGDKTTEVTYTVNFMIEDKIVETQTVKEGKPLKKPSNNIEQGYKINYWVFENGERVNWNSSTVKSVTRDMTLKANYSELITLEFKVGEEVFAVYEVVKGNDYVKPERNPEAEEGQVFLGWAIEGESDKFDFSQKATESAVFVALFGPFTGEESISVLFIGNSFSDDTIALAYKVADSAGIKDIKIADLYIGGCTINRHISEANSNSADYLFRYFDKDNQNTNVDTTAGTKRTMEYGITYSDWDWIIFQQGSWASGLPNEYGNFQTLIDYVKGKATNPNVKFGFNMTWAYAQNSTNGGFSNYGNNQQTMYSGILNAVQTQVATKSEIIKIIPNGTAIQNARSSFVGDTLTRDVSDHLTYDLGRYIAAMSLVKTLCGPDLNKVTYAPSGLSQTHIAMAKESVNNAIKTPYAVTTSAYQSIVDGMSEIAVTFTQGWYDSTLANGTDLQTGAAYLNQYKATQKFTKEMLPVGSVIYIASGWKYRPEGWINGEAGASRPGNVSTQYIEITEEWWGSYTERAFNISTTGTTDISGKTQADMESVFKIYLPEQ